MNAKKINELWALAATRHGLLTTSEITAKVGETGLKHLLRMRHIERLCRGVYRVAGAPVTKRQTVAGIRAGPSGRRRNPLCGGAGWRRGLHARQAGGSDPGEDHTITEDRRRADRARSLHELLAGESHRNRRRDTAHDPRPHPLRHVLSACPPRPSPRSWTTASGDSSSITKKSHNVGRKCAREVDGVQR